MRLRRAVGIERYPGDADAKLRGALREHFRIGDNDQLGRIIVRGELYAQIRTDAGRFAGRDGQARYVIHSSRRGGVCRI